MEISAPYRLESLYECALLLIRRGGVSGGEGIPNDPPYTLVQYTNYNIRKMQEPEALRPETQEVQKGQESYEFHEMVGFI